MTDLVGWTDVVHPAVRLPLQSRVVELRQRRSQLQQELETRMQLTCDVRNAGRELVKTAASLTSELTAAVAYRSAVDDESSAAQRQERQIRDAVRSEAPRLARLQGEIREVESQRAAVIAAADRERQRVGELRDRCKQLEARHEQLSREVQDVDARAAVKVEVVGSMRRSVTDVDSAVTVLRALRAIGSKPGACCGRWGAVACSLAQG